MIAHYWTTGGLPDDDQQLANIVRLSLGNFEVHKPVLKQFFFEGWKHKRIDLEMQRCAEIRLKRAAAGSKGGTIAQINRYKKNR